MKKILLVAAAVLVLAPSASADSLTAIGGSWQNWTAPNDAGGGGFWDVRSWDGPACNVGFWLQGPGSGCLNATFGDFYTSSPAINDPATRFLNNGGLFAMTGDGSSSLTGVASSVGATALATTDVVGWFNLDDRSQLFPLVAGGAVAPAFTIPSGNYGFYAQVTIPGNATQTFYSDTLQGTRNQFVIFDISRGGQQSYVIGLEDLVTGGPWGSDYDYNDMMMVLTYTPVPEPASMLLLGVGLIGGAAMIRKRTRK